MATEGTKFETKAPDGDRVEVVVTKVLMNTYNIEIGELHISGDFKDIEEARMFKDQVYRHIFDLVKQHNGEVTTGTEVVYRQTR